MTITNNYNINAKFNYTDRKINIALSAGNNATSLPTRADGNPVTYVARVLNSEGTTISLCRLLEPQAGQAQPNKFVVSDDFGLSFDYFDGAGATLYTAKWDLAGGKDRSAESGSVFVDHYPLHWSAEPYIETLGGLVPSYVPEVESGVAGSAEMHWSKKNDDYLNTPLVVTNGDAVTFGTIATVVNDNEFTLTIPSTVTNTSYTSEPIVPAIAEIVSGSDAGTVFWVTETGSSRLVARSQLVDYSGQLVKLMPYRTVTGYEGYSIDSFTTYGSNAGDGGPEAEFRLDSNIPINVGSVTLTDADYDLSTLAAVSGIDLLSRLTTASITGTVIDFDDMPELSYVKDVTVGSVVVYTEGGGATNTGVVCNLQAGGARDKYFVFYPPAPSMDDTQDITIYRPNTFKLLSYPQFGEEHSIEVLPSSSGQYIDGLAPRFTGVYDNNDPSEQFTSTVTAPGATLDFSANDYESQFAQISETSNFHVGPIHLSNGENIMDDSIGTDKLPFLKSSLVVLGGDPTVWGAGSLFPGNAPHVDTTVYAAQDPQVAHKFAGNYVYRGVSTFTTSTSFISAETLHCEATVSYGSATITKVFALPVQPSA